MNRSLRFGTALSALAISAALPGCALGGDKSAATAAKVDRSKIGIGSRALAALDSGNYAEAVSLAEQAVESKPNDALFRAVLANSYFGAGRFASAEAAFRDALALDPNQPKMVLKLALSQIAQGKTSQAIGRLQSAQGMLDVADYGLAIALAGVPQDAVAVLNQAARQPGADARIRQNLALALALTGDWTEARTIAAQDVPAAELDQRLQQWMQIAKPTRASDQVAALTGVTPVADPGQPSRLALTRPEPSNVQVATVQQAAPQQVAAIDPLAITPQLPEAQPLPMPEAQPLPMQPVTATLFAEAKARAEKAPVRFDEKPKTASYVAITKTVRRAAATARADGKSDAVVQLGAYGSPQRVETAWTNIAKRHPSVGRYHPMSARFDGGAGTVYRLSVKGFASAGEAQKLCGTLKSSGQSCFVRRVAGDAPVRFASR